MSIDWNMVEALGTIFAASVALLFGLRDVLERYLNKPKIILDHFPEERYIITDRDWCQLNISLTNNGSITAKNINVKMESIIQDNTNKIPKSNIYLIFRTVDSLQNKDYVFFPLIMVTRDSGFIEIFPHRFKLERKNFSITFLVTGDNILAFRKTFKYIDSTDHNKIKLLAS